MTNVRTALLLVVWIVYLDKSYGFSVPSAMLQPPIIVNDNKVSLQSPSEQLKGYAENNRDAIALVRPVDTGTNRAPIQFKDYVPFLAVLGLAMGSSLVYGDLLPLLTTVDVELLYFALCSLIGAYQFNIPVKHEVQEIDRSWDLLWKNIFNSLRLKY